MEKGDERLASQAVFKRYELKYILTAEQKSKVEAAMAPYMQLDKYGRTTIRNIYYDTDTFLLIRRSIEKPVYKEKLRVRSYGPATPQSKVFVELKKKYKSTVYKRRVSLPHDEAVTWLARDRHCHKHTQICDEIDYFIEHYGTLRPTVFLSYEREAYYTKEPSDFRVTFDENILVRQDELTLISEAYGTPILSEGMTLMEIKCSGGIPLWMTEVLSREKIFKTSFSKYGTAYRTLIFPELRELFTTHSIEEEHSYV